jgi:adenosylcobinamide-GDP ribazoletransferase
MNRFYTALASLSILPVPQRGLPDEEAIAQSRFFYPAAGIVLGALLALWTMLWTWLTVPAVAAYLVVAGWVALTGALHLDGLGDLCDGLFGGRTPEQRLKIMHDPHRGTFGLLAVTLLLLGKYVLVHELLSSQLRLAPWVLAMAVAAGRCLVLFLAAGTRYPRPEGLGKVLIEATPAREANLWAGLVLPAAFLAMPFNEPVRALVLAAVTVLVVLVLKIVCQELLGGTTGDCLGGGIELAEWTFVLMAVLLVPPAAAPPPAVQPPPHELPKQPHEPADVPKDQTLSKDQSDPQKDKPAPPKEGGP